MADAESPDLIKLVATCAKCGARLSAAATSERNAGSATSDHSPADRNTGSATSDRNAAAAASDRNSNLCPQCRADAADDDDDNNDEFDSQTTAGATKLEAQSSGESAKSADGDVANALRGGKVQAARGSSQESSSKAAPEAGLKKPLHDPDVPDEYEIIEAYPECKNGRAYKVKDTRGKELVVRFFTAGVARSTGGLPIEAVARLLVQQDHPNLQTVYNWRPELGTSCLVLDAPPAVTVESIIKREGFFDLARAIDIFIDVCDAVEELHKQKLIHGFIRPRTIGLSVSESGVDVAKVTNFSITNVYSNMLDQPLKIGRNYTCHDSFYMSPEELDGKVVDQASDIYSLGCVLFHAITGKPVYRGKTVRDVIDQHLSSERARFRKRYEIPDDVETVVLRMIEKDPAARYKSIRAIRIDLERLRDKKQPIIEDMWRKFFWMFGGR